MKKYKYIKWHNNYDEFKLNEIYEGYWYKPGWLCIEVEYKENGRLCREECFEEIEIGEI